MNYELDAGQARKADQRGGMINETGKYIGRITRAEDITTDKGTKGIDFSFVSRDNAKTRFALYTEKKDGTRIGIGHAFVMALMTCLKVRSIKPTEQKVKKWDADEEQKPLGSHALRTAALLTEPHWLVCGHIHTGSHVPEALGTKTLAVNVSLVDERYNVRYRPFEFTIRKGE